MINTMMNAMNAMNAMNYMNFIINNIDLIKGVSLLYIVPQIIYYIYSYNTTIRQHIQENKNMHILIKDMHNSIKEIHQQIVKT
jgi:hypothetical protein